MTRKDYKVCANICATLMQYQEMILEAVEKYYDSLPMEHVLNVFVCELNMAYSNFDSDKFEKYTKGLLAQSGSASGF
tara:strand:+ start:626 stop:856 length:231 start_codon:yes stop_codon:yes gene_type:complete